MRFQVVRLRFRGRPLPKREWCNRPPAVGDLRVEQLYDEELPRRVRIARVVRLIHFVGPEPFPALYDPVLSAMSPQAFTLAGFERVDGVDRAQSWLVTTVSWHVWSSPETTSPAEAGLSSKCKQLPLAARKAEANEAGAKADCQSNRCCNCPWCLNIALW
jgi:hypothetical protein